MQNAAQRDEKYRRKIKNVWNSMRSSTEDRVNLRRS